MTRNDRIALAILAAITAVKLGLAARLGLLADEAYYWVWALHPAFGYYDQPPLVAWLIALTRPLGDGELQVRLTAIASGAAIPLALWPHARDRVRLVVLSAMPAMFALTLVATPDAPLLALWAGALSAALLGGPWWLLCGALAGGAFLAKYTAAAILPLCIGLAGPSDWKTRWPWLGVGLAGLVVAPNLAWNATHGWVSFVFQLHEGVLNPHPPGLDGPVHLVLDQAAVACPLLALAGVAWVFANARELRDRQTRILWGSTVGLFGFFLLTSLGGPPEAHWPIPLWLGLGLGLANAEGRLARIADVGVFAAALCTAVLAVHLVWPLLPIPDDPGLRFETGPLLGEGVAAWAFPAGRPLASRDPEGAMVVYTERYQEAALIEFYTGVPARRFPGCGRADQYDLWPADPPPAEALMIRPFRYGPTLCTDEAYPNRLGPYKLEAVDPRGRLVDAWNVFQVSR